MSAPQRINFGHLMFEGPTPAAHWVPPSGAGLYAILVMDRLCHPQPFRPIHFGRTRNFAEHASLSEHDRYWEWRAVADSEANLYVATCPMPSSSEAARASAENELVEHYRLGCYA